MGKIKLNLASGAVVEKPLISAFSASGNSYIIFDNEMNGSMGLPIILVCKYADNRVIKVDDANEWQIVKEYLKNIIAGNAVEYISIPESLPAADIYYTQLTLPVQSFDALKNSYNVISSESSMAAESSAVVEEPQPIENPSVTPAVDNVTPIVEPTPVVESTPVAPTPVVSPEPVMNTNEVPVVDNSTTPVIEPTPVQNTEPLITPTPVIEPTVPPMPSAPVQDTVQNVANELNSINTPIVDINPVADIVTPEEPANMQTEEVQEPVNNFVDINDITPVTDAPSNNTAEIVNNDPNDIFKDQKEAFMQACENMFDALVQKFQKELQNK